MSNESKQTNNSEQPVLYGDSLPVLRNVAVEKARRDWYEHGASRAYGDGA
ncbi:MAG: hypothetical protein K2J80_04060 [Oscillospiraceae bacterium]|nr:hypothetical protein [Oscillospiraceae bacterium]